jgi:hypothetical protein
VVNRLAWRLQLVRHSVGVEHVRATLTQQFQHGAFAASDVAGEANDIQMVMFQKEPREYHP